jgi:hypothetical protein
VTEWRGDIYPVGFLRKIYSFFFEDGIRSSFRSVAFFSSQDKGRWTKSKNLVILRVIHHARTLERAARYWLLVAVLTVQFVPHRKHTPP